MKIRKIAKTVSLLFLALLLVSIAASAYARHRGPVAEHIILLIGDGMNIEHEIATSRYLYGKDFELSFHKLPYKANVSTWDVTTYNHWAAALGMSPYSPDAIKPTLGYDPAKGGKKPYPLGPELSGAEDYLKAKATDSASAATAIGTGYKTDDGNIAWLPGDAEGGALKTIAEILREKKGYAIGSEILTVVRPEVVIGGGHPGTDGSPTYRYISETDYTRFRSGAYVDEYVFVEREVEIDGGLNVLAAAQQAVAEGKKLFGLFGMEGGGNFESLEPKDLPGTPLVTQATRENPTFAEAMLAALKVLSQDPDGFFLMAEQGDIDWANHSNDFQRMVGTSKDLHDGVQTVIDFVNQPGDGMDWSNTLLMITSDHSNSYMRNKMELGAGDLPDQVAGGSCPPGSYCGAFSYPDGEVTYGSGGHTNELVRLYALGAGLMKFHKYEGKWYPGTRILDNTQLFHMVMEAAGLPVSSPLILN